MTTMTVERKLIGKGHFTKAYLVDGRVELVSSDPIKECMSMGWFPESRLFADVKFEHHNMNETNTYSMEYFDRPKSLKNSMCEHDWDLYLTLKSLFNVFQNPMNPHMLHSEWHKAFDMIPDRFVEEREELKEALDACANYGSDICFEISPRNIAVKDSRLILLDCFFVRSKLKN